MPEDGSIVGAAGAGAAAADSAVAAAADADAEQIARLWLGRLGREVSSEAVHELAPFVGGADAVGREGNAWRAIVRRGGLPTPEAVRRAARRTVSRQDLGTANSLTAPAKAEAAARFVQAYRAEHGEGPPWLLLARSMGWDSPRTVVDAAVRRLRAEGWLTFTNAPRSLDVGDRGRRALATPTEDRPEF